MRIVPGFCLREILGETIAVPTGSAAEQLSGLVSLNETAAFLFSRLQTEHTADELVDALLAEYDTDRQTAEQDVQQFLDVMRAHHLLLEDRGVAE